MRSHRLAISLSPFVHEQLRQRASKEGRTAANLAAFLVEREVRADAVLTEMQSTSTR